MIPSSGAAAGATVALRVLATVVIRGEGRDARKQGGREFKKKREAGTQSLLTAGKCCGTRTGQTAWPRVAFVQPVGQQRFAWDGGGNEAGSHTQSFRRRNNAAVRVTTGGQAGQGHSHNSRDEPTND